MAAARHRLPVSARFDSAPAIVAEGELDALRSFCRNDRLSGLLASAVADGEIALAGSDSCGSEIELINDDWHSALDACVLLEALLVRTAGRLDDVGARWLLSKGPALAHLDYPDPALRVFADIDIVVHGDDWEKVLDVFGVDRVRLRRTLAFVERFGKGLTVTVDDMEVDLHLRFAIGRFGMLCRMRECFEAPESIQLAGRQIWVPAVEYRLLHACYHACLGGAAELRAFSDVARLALRSPGTLSRTWQVAGAWGVEAVVAAAITETWARLDLPPDHDVVRSARDVDQRRIDRKALAVFESHTSFRRRSLTALSALGPLDRARFVSAALRMHLEHRR